MDEDLQVGAPSQGTQVQESNIAEHVNDTTNAEQQTESQPQEQPRIKVKYNHEEKELGLDEATQYVQKGMNYDKIHEKATKLEQDYQLAKEYGAEFGVYSVEDIQRLYGENGITTVQEFKEAANRQRLIDQGKDPDLEWAREQRQKHEETQKNWNDFLQLKEDFPEIKNPEDIPAEVIAIKEERKCSFSDAMTRYELNQAKAKLNEFAKGAKTQEANNNNAQSSTGSVGGQGNVPPATLTDEIINSMSDKERASRWGEIKKFYGMK